MPLKIPADTRPKSWYNPIKDREVSFRSTSRLTETEPHSNPRRWGTKNTLAARLFVGLNVGQTPTYTVDDVIKIVVAKREAQGHKPDSSFLTQKGVFTSNVDGKLVFEDSVQIVIIDGGGSKKKAFTKEIEQLAEDLATELSQEEVVCETQRNGLTLETFSIEPRKAHRT